MMISNVNIDKNALDIVKKLQQAGYEAYLVGGCVRDLLLKQTPKDFDVATNAHPQEIKMLFKNCRLIGRRFRLAHIYFGRKVIEVATFRAPHDAENEHTSTDASGMIVRDNMYGTLEEDALRRDFTINAFYYNPENNEVLDQVAGMEDLSLNLLRLIGEPNQRYREDPVRMLRAIRFAAKLEFSIESSAAAAIVEQRHLLKMISSARLFEEVVKLFHGGHGARAWELLRHYQFVEILFPELAHVLNTENNEIVYALIDHTLKNTDTRVQENKTVTPAFLYAVLLWYPIQLLAKRYHEQGVPMSDALQLSTHEILREQQKTTAIPRYLSAAIKEICHMQYHLERRYGRKPLRLLQHPRFRAGYDLLMLRGQVGEIELELGQWWTEFQNSSEEQRQEMLRDKSLIPHARRRRRRKSSK